MSAPYIGIGATVSVGGTLLVNPTKVTIPWGDVGFEKYSTLNQSDKLYRKIPTMVDPGKVSGEMIYSSADLATLTAVRGTLASIVITTSDSTPKTYTFQGIVTKAEPEMSPDKIVMCKWDCEVAGPVTLS
jgi:hypothetical protein